MERYYVCDCPKCGDPKYSKSKRMYPALLKRMQEWECYSCSKSSEKNPSYGKVKTEEWIKTVSEKNKGCIGYWAGKTRTSEHKQKISKGLITAYETKKRVPNGYNISLGMHNSLALNLSEIEYKQLLSEKKKYYNEVHKITKRQAIHTLEFHENRGKAKKGTDNYQLDHIIPISEGFRDNINPNIIGDISNLRFIPWKENILRNKLHNDSKNNK
jgi:hypothetical protein